MGLGSGGIASGAGRIVRYIDLPPLSALVAETTARGADES